MKRILFFILIYSVSIGFILAQNTEKVYQDKLYLIDGSTLYGSFEGYTAEGDILFILKNGKRLRFDSKIVRKLKMKKMHPTDEFKVKSWYNTLNLSLLSGNSGRRNNYRIGISYSYSVGYRWSNWLSLGTGTGWTTYGIDTKEYFIPVYAELTSYLSKGWRSPFFRLQVGGAFNLVNHDFIEKATGGLYIHPAFGWRLTGKTKLNYIIDIGYKIQRAKYVYKDVGSRGTPRIREQNILYNRLNFNFGLLF